MERDKPIVKVYLNCNGIFGLLQNLYMKSKLIKNNH